MSVRAACPQCGADRYQKQGYTRHGHHNHYCKACGRPFVSTAENGVIADAQRKRIESLLCERLSVRGSCRAVGIRLTWLLPFMVERLAACPEPLHVRVPAGPTDVVVQHLEAETDERWSLVGKKANKPWIWIALAVTTRQVIACHVGDRSRESAVQLWGQVPEVYRQQAIFHTDLSEVYTGVIPAEQHRALTKRACKTHHVERFNHTLGQRVSRRVRRTLSFSKKLANHVGAINFFIGHYHLTKVAALPV